MGNTIITIRTVTIIVGNRVSKARKNRINQQLINLFIFGHECKVKSGCHFKLLTLLRN